MSLDIDDARAGLILSWAGELLIGAAALGLVFAAFVLL